MTQGVRLSDKANKHYSNNELITEASSDYFGDTGIAANPVLIALLGTRRQA